MHAGDDRVRGYNETAPRLAIHESGIVEKPEPARPGERRKETPDPLEFSELVRSHRRLHFRTTQAAPDLVEDPVGEARLLTREKGMRDGSIFADRDPWRDIAPMYKLVGTCTEDRAKNGVEPRQRPFLCESRGDCRVETLHIGRHSANDIGKQRRIGLTVLVAVDLVVEPMSGKLADHRFRV